MKKQILLMSVIGISVLIGGESRAEDRPDILIADFESATYGDWKTTGEAFGPGPAQGTLPNQMPVDGYLGHGLVNSYFHGDGTTGTLTSSPFRIERKFVNFLIGGGKHPGETCINLLIDGKVVRTETGPNGEPGGSEHLDWAAWDVSSFAGKMAAIEIVDKNTGGWGHINIDQITQSDKRKTNEPASREIVVRQKYLLLPVKTGAPKRVVKYLIEGKIVREFDIELAAERPTFRAADDVSAFQGKTVRLESVLPSDCRDLEAIAPADDLPDAGAPYQEPIRPQFHFTARQGWHNDPNGLVYHDGEYHLFFQHNPYGWNWGNMHWGHAVSPDLLHWKQMPEAIRPARYGDWAFSGSAIVDKDNTSGFGKADAPAIVAAFTSTGRGECIVSSTDRGHTFREFEGNPAVKHSGRDPRLLWFAPKKCWIMAVYDEFEGKRFIAFHSSPDLKKWTFESRIEGFFECPELFPIVVEGEPAVSKWVLYAADGQYLIGQFDGHEFHPDVPAKQRVWFGNFYASQTFSNVPDGRRIQIGWGSGITFPDMPFNQQMTVPVTLTLRRGDGGVRMFAQPIKELGTLRGPARKWSDLAVEPGTKALEGAGGELLDIVADIEINEASAGGLIVRGTPILYDAKAHELDCGPHKAPLMTKDGHIQLRILVDRGSVEVFANEGRVAISLGVLAKPEARSIELTAKGGPARLRSLEVYELQSIWR